MEKLLKFQKQVESITKDSKNPFFKSSYLSLNGLLDAIKPLLNELELVLIQPLTSIDGRPAISTKLLDGDKTIIESTITLPDLTDPQKMGSAITYYRRYSIQSLLLLQAEDDDGNIASGKVNVKEKMQKELSKATIANWLKNKLPELSTKEDYENACLEITGIELKEENYNNILKFISNK